jgi:hypothetical protein
MIKYRKYERKKKTFNQEEHLSILQEGKRKLQTAIAKKVAHGYEHGVRKHPH